MALSREPAAGQWAALFPAGERVVALPGWGQPRLLIPLSGRRERWRRSAWFPAYRAIGRIYRIACRVRATTAAAARTVDTESHSSIAGVLTERFGRVRVGAVLVGMPSSTTKFTVMLEDEAGQPVSFVKCLSGGNAHAKIEKEAMVLAHLPPGMGPAVLGRARAAGFHLLMLAPLHGARVPARVPPPHELRAFTNRLHGGAAATPERHPWFRRLLERRPDAGAVIAPLVGRAWPISIQHGDLTPWNLVDQAGTVAAYDWEDATLDGLSLADHAHYVLQVGGLVQRWSPAHARRVAASWLQVVDPQIDAAEALSIVRLAAMSGHLRSADEGHPPSDAAQVWKQEVFGGSG